MAKRTSSSRSSTRATSRKSSASTDVEVVEEADGAGIDAGIIIMTFIVLIVALGLLDKVASVINGSGKMF